MLISALLVAASVVGDSEGCTPEYRKTHADSWEEYSPTPTVSSVCSDSAGTSYANLTLLQALSLKGGPGVAGAQETCYEQRSLHCSMRPTTVRMVCTSSSRGDAMPLG